MLNIYFYLLESNQGEEIKLKVISSLRVHLVNEDETVQLKKQQSNHLTKLPLSSLCLELLKCCCFEAKLKSIRYEACKCIYELLKQDFACIQSHLIVSLSQLINNKETSFVRKQALLKQSTKNLRQSLSMLKSLAFKDHDKLSGNEELYQQVDNLTKRIQNIFEATCKMKQYTLSSASPSNNENDCNIDTIIDSQLTLVKSYVNSLQLKKTWLQSIADIHVREKNYSEAAHAYLFIAALIADYLKYKGVYTLGSSVFKKIAPNIELDQNLITYLDDSHDNINEDTSFQLQYTMVTKDYC
jgi:dedicator of cytokinesis protein 9/10/11